MRKIPATLLVVWVVTIAILLVMPVDSEVWSDWTWTRHDAAIHAVLFFGLGLLGVLSFKRPAWHTVLLIVVGGLLLGGGMEVVQGLLPWGRAAAWSDFHADAAGLLLGVIVGWTLGRLTASRDAASPRPRRRRF